MVTDGWDSVKTEFARLFGRGDAEKSATAAEGVEWSRGVLTGLTGIELEQAKAVQLVAWAARLADLLKRNPDAAVELEALVNRMASAPRTGHVKQIVTSSANVQQAIQGQGIQTNSFGGQDDVSRR
jgi:hypothetical protein